MTATESKLPNDISVPPSMTDTSNKDGLESYMTPWVYSKVKDSNRLEANLMDQCRILRGKGQDRKAEILLRTISKIRRCRMDFIEFHLQGNPNQKKRHPFYCQDSLCPICYQYISYTSNKKVLSKLASVRGEMYGVYTFSPPNLSANRLKSFVTQLKKVPPKVFSPQCRKLSEFIDGSIRFIGLTYHRSSGFNVHLHVILHFRRTISEQEAGEIYVMLNKRFIKFLNLKNAESHLAIREYTFENLKRTASYLTKYEDHQNLSRNITWEIKTYNAYRKAYKYTRWINYSGCYGDRYLSMVDLEEMEDNYSSEGQDSVKIYEFKSGH